MLLAPNNRIMLAVAIGTTLTVGGYFGIRYLIKQFY
jgi:hypothetical protein